jgi:hypothetical protein
MIILAFLIFIGVGLIEMRVSKLAKIQAQTLNAQREIAKAMQWMVDNWESRK